MTQNEMRIGQHFGRLFLPKNAASCHPVGQRGELDCLAIKDLLILGN
jgi:hypothetical protein